MIRTTDLRTLKKLETDELVYVESVRKLYRREQGEWIERVCYSTNEIAAMCGITQTEVQRIIRKLHIRTKIMRNGDLRFAQISAIAGAITMKRQHPSYTWKKIKQKLRV